MKACIRWQLRVLGYAWWLLLLLPVLALLMGWEATAVLLKSKGNIDPSHILAIVLDARHLFPLAGAAWAVLFLGMDYDADAFALALCRGYDRRQLLFSKILLYFFGCLVMSVIEQVFAVLAGVPERSSLSIVLLLRCFFMRLVLDLGEMSPPAFLCYLGRDNLYIRLLGLVYGISLWRLMGTHYSLWLPYARWERGEWLALWPIAILFAINICFLTLDLKE